MVRQEPDCAPFFCYGRGRIAQVGLGIMVFNLKYLLFLVLILPLNAGGIVSRFDEGEGLSRTRGKFLGHKDYLSTLKNSATLTIDSGDVDSTLTNFPVTIFLNASAGTGSADCSAFFTELGAYGGSKIAITNATGTQLYIEKELYNFGMLEAVYHVKVPSIASGADTVLTLWYDGAAQDNSRYVGTAGTRIGEQVWDSNFVGVYHMNEAAGSTVIDSTVSSNDGTPVDAPTSNTSGAVGNALTFDGANDYVSLGEPASMDFDADVDSFTLECWATHTATAQDFLISKNVENVANKGQFRINTPGANQKIAVVIGGGWAASAGNEFTSSFKYAAVRSYASAWKCYINAANKAAGTPGTDAAAGIDVLIAASRDVDNTTTLGHWVGSIDEVRISIVARTEDWVEVSYESQRDDFIAITGF